MDLRETFAKRIKALREKKGLSCVQLAKELGVSSASLGYYERKERVPDIEVLNMFCKYYNVSADYLMGLSDVASLDIEKQKVANYLRLSEKAVDEIKKQTNNYFSKAVLCAFLELHLKNVVGLLFKVLLNSQAVFESNSPAGAICKSTGNQSDDIEIIEHDLTEKFSDTEYCRYNFVKYAEVINDSFDARSYMHFVIKRNGDLLALMVEEDNDSKYGEWFSQKVKEDDNGKHNET